MFNLVINYFVVFLRFPRIVINFNYLNLLYLQILNKCCIFVSSKQQNTMKVQVFEGENDFLETFEGHNGNMCIMLNAKCISSIKSKKKHERKLSQLIEDRGLIEVEL